MLGVGREMWGFPRICLGRPPEGPSRHLSCIFLRYGERKGCTPLREPILQVRALTLTSSSFCVPELSSAWIHFCSTHHVLAKSSAKGSNPANTYWLCELSKGSVGALPK